MPNPATRVCVVRSSGVIAPLIMDCYERALRKLGMETHVLDLARAANSATKLAELLEETARWQPHLAICYGYSGIRGGGFFRKHNIPLAILIYDSPFIGAWQIIGPFLQEIAIYPEAYHCFVWDQVYRKPLMNLGIRNLHPIMLAADPSIFAPRTPSYRFDLAFVGRMGDPHAYRSARQAKCSLRVNAFVDQLLEQRIGSPAASLIGLWQELAAKSFPELLFDWTDPDTHGLHRTVHEEGSARLRGALLGAIRSVQADVFGSDWSLPGINSHPTVDYGRELPAVYSDSRINLNITSLQMERSLNNRIFDVASVGGFLLTDRGDDLKTIMPDCAPLTYRSAEELDAKVAHFLAHESERKELARELQKAIMKAHTYEHRVIEVFKAITGKG